MILIEIVINIKTVIVIIRCNWLFRYNFLGINEMLAHSPQIEQLLKEEYDATIEGLLMECDSYTWLNSYIKKQYWWNS